MDPNRARELPCFLKARNFDLPVTRPDAGDNTSGNPARKAGWRSRAAGPSLAYVLIEWVEHLHSDRRKIFHIGSRNRQLVRARGGSRQAGDDGDDKVL